MNKYHNTKVTVDGYTFDSKKEAQRYKELKLLENCRIISGLKLQPKYTLLPSQRRTDGKPERPVTYIADFEYTDSDGNRVVEDVKGMKTAEYKIKRKLMLYVHGITVIET